MRENFCFIRVYVALALITLSSAIYLCTEDPTENPDFVICEKEANNLHAECVGHCVSEMASLQCWSDCNREFYEFIIKCPCEEGYPNGCPCDNYECPVLTTISMTTTTTTVENSTTTSLSTSSTAFGIRFIKFLKEPNTDQLNDAVTISRPNLPNAF